MISCDHEHCKENRINDRIMSFECEDCGGYWVAKPDEPYWTPFKTQEYICFECYEDMMLI